MKTIKIKFQNGITLNGALTEIFSEIQHDFIFKESTVDPDFILFGPYGNDLPPPGNYIRIGYFCENIKPDLDICEWAFGIPTEKEINHSRYKRIQWHGLNPDYLLKNIDIDRIYNGKTKFCNFVYSNPVPYREEFFKQLSKYKKIDAPGKSMKNMRSLESFYQGSKWEIKRRFLAEYKFTIAFESYSYPGYQTEKLYDAMRSNSIPIYCGDPLVNNIFNSKSFLNTFDYISRNNGLFTRGLERLCQYDFKDYRPGTYNNLPHMVKRKLKSIGKLKKMEIELNKFDYTALIDKIIDLDNNPEAYIKMLREPWFPLNKIPIGLSSKERWIEIFNHPYEG